MLLSPVAFPFLKTEFEYRGMWKASCSCDFPTAFTSIPAQAAEGAWTCTSHWCPSPCTAGVVRRLPKVKKTVRPERGVREKFMRAELSDVSKYLVFHVGDTYTGRVRVSGSFVSKSCLLLQLFVGLATGRIWSCMLFSLLILAHCALGEPWRAASLPPACLYCWCSLFSCKLFSLLLQ